MPFRSIRITLFNNTQSKLTLVGPGGAQLCQGKWTDGSPSPPLDMGQGLDVNFQPVKNPPNNPAFWQSESGGGSFLTGTEGWVKYVVSAPFDPRTSIELVHIHWNFPYIPGNKFVPVDFNVTTTDWTPPCHDDQGGGKFDGLPGGGSCLHEVFIAGVSSTPAKEGLSFGTGGGDATGNEVFSWATMVFWPAMVVFAASEYDQDVHLEVTLAVRIKNSVSSSICSFYDGKQGLMALTSKAGQPSLKKLFDF
jgi:hypothetical protein